jgi:hypothetical protein
MAAIVKDPNANLDYGVDWSDWLGEDETIVTSTWVVPEGLTQGAAGFEGGRTVVWLTGGTDGQSYAVVNRITTSQDRTDDRSIPIIVANR